MFWVWAPSLWVRMDTGYDLVNWVGYGFNIILVWLWVEFRLRFVGLG